jgi:hypothetical protein
VLILHLRGANALTVTFVPSFFIAGLLSGESLHRLEFIMPRFAIGFCLISFAILSPSASAAVVGYQYSGLVNFVFPAPPPPFGVTVPNSAAASGTFWYDTDAVGVPLDGNTVRYSQDHWLTMTLSAPGFGGLAAESFNYLMEVSNDLAQPAGGPADIVSFVFSSSLIPNSFWQVNGHPLPGESPLPGLLRLNFMASSAARADSSIPADLGFALLPQPNQLFADTPTGMVDVIFMITNLTPLAPSAEPPHPVPEPSSLVLLGLGAAFTYALRRKRLGTAARPSFDLIG